MKCPFCGATEDKVVDSRESKDAGSIRRRRECLECERRYSTLERIEESLPMVVKKDGRREPFSRDKIIMGIQRACEKRPVAMEQIEELAEHIERSVRDLSEKEVDSTVIGEQIIVQLRQLDEVAYVRFASVYRQFKDVEEFMRELQSMVGKRQND